MGSKFATEIITVSDEEEKKMTRILSMHYGWLVGFSSGANVMTRMKLANSNLQVKNIATVLCDTGYKYSIV